MIPLTRLFCLGIGSFLVIDGITGLIFAGTGLSTGDKLPHQEWNFFFQFNDWHHLAHIFSGGILVFAGLKKPWMPLGLFSFGAFYALLTPLGFIDGNDVLDVVYSDSRDNVIHATLALLAVALGLLVRQSSAAMPIPLGRG